MPKGAVDNINSSNKRVKSNRPGQLSPTAGPKRSFTAAEQFILGVLERFLVCSVPVVTIYART
jgi:hypothetical protein